MGAAHRQGGVHADEFHGRGLLAFDAVHGDDVGPVDADELPFRKHFQQGFHRDLGDDVLLVVQVQAGVVVPRFDVLDGGERHRDVLVVGLVTSL